MFSHMIKVRKFSYFRPPSQYPMIHITHKEYKQKYFNVTDKIIVIVEYHTNIIK